MVSKSNPIGEKRQNLAHLRHRAAGQPMTDGGTTKTIDADDTTTTENNVDAAVADAAAAADDDDDGCNGADSGDESHRNRTLRCGSVAEVEPDRLPRRPVVIYCTLWLGGFRCRPGRSDSACWSPATGRHSPCGINAYKGGA